MPLAEFPEDEFPLYHHASFCLLAEFDIDSGSSVRHQWPHKTGTDEQSVLSLSLCLVRPLRTDGAGCEATWPT